MLYNILFWYLVVADALFVTGAVVGSRTKKDILGNGVRLGITNSFLLAAVWPLTIVAMLIGWCYDMAQTWKRI